MPKVVLKPAAKKRAPRRTKAAPAATAALLTTAQAAALLEIGPERVRQLVKSGHIEKRGKDQVPLVSAVRGYIRFLKDDERRSSKSASASRVQDARAEEIALRVAERRGRLVDIVEHNDIFTEAFGTLKSEFAGIPARLTSDITFRRKIETEHDDAFRRCADRFESATADLAPDRSPDPTDGGDDT
jgi:hypothetical protein